MRISVTYEDSDVAKALAKIIKDPNAEEFIKLITPMICTSQQASEYFFKLMLGNKLPEVIPNGTLCRVHVNHLGYSSNKDAIKQQFADEFGTVIVTIKEFRGFHEYSQYQIEYTDITSSGDTKKDTTYVQSNQLEVIEDL
jgi:hypothetical protein